MLQLLRPGSDGCGGPWLPEPLLIAAAAGVGCGCGHLPSQPDPPHALCRPVNNDVLFKLDNLVAQLAVMTEITIIMLNYCLIVGPEIFYEFDIKK